jgi:hypothetical protein
MNRDGDQYAYGRENDWSGDDSSNKRDRRSSDEIKADICRTRAQLDETIDELQCRLAPEQIIHNVFDVLREHVNDAVQRTVQAVRENPVPVALIGIGAVWLLATRSQRCRVPEVSVYEYDEYERYEEPVQTAL